MRPIQTRFTAFPVLTTSVAVLLAGAVSAMPDGRQRRTLPLSVTQVFVELNDTDGDLGLHAEIDGSPWHSLEIEGPGDRTLLGIAARGRLGVQGLTQLAFESAEPPFDELAPADFFNRFPEGDYEVEAIGPGRQRLAGRSTLSHVLAAPPANITVNGLPAAEDCDAEPLPEVGGAVLVRWDPVTSAHPEIGRQGPVTIARYQLFAEREGLKFSIDLPPAVTEFELPAAFTATPGPVKYEIIARTNAGNNTAVETCFIAR